MRSAAETLRHGAVATALAALAGSHAAGAVVEFRVRAPEGTPAEASLFVAGDLPALGSWRADGVPLRRDGETWVARVDVGDVPRAEFKITRGSWDRCEVAADGAARPNRAVEVAALSVTVEVRVERWREPPAPTRTGDIRTLPVAASADGSIPAREALVLLPDGYDAATDARYPVYYFLDGQNVFDAATSFLGIEWRADETALQLAKDGAMPPAIVVAIPNVPDRVREYSLGVPDGRGERHLAWLVDTVKKDVDARFRTKADPAHTTIAGSSLGGLFALEAIERRPDVFGNAIAMSPSLWRADEALLKRWADPAKRPSPRRLWIDMGTKESGDDAARARNVERARELAALFGTSAAVRLEIDDGAEHNESAWQARLPRAFRFVSAGAAAAPPAR
jgi:predicted alpha/beta superfamily hydrolase